VSLDPSSGAPRDSFQMTVTNTGNVQDTYNLSLAGPAALVASLGSTTVTLAPGDSQVIPITTGTVNFAVAGKLQLAAIATSQTDPAVTASATASLNLPVSQGMTARFSPPSRIITHGQPGQGQRQRRVPGGQDPVADRVPGPAAVPCPGHENEVHGSP
jgi:hypothetical protein